MEGHKAAAALSDGLMGWMGGPIVACKSSVSLLHAVVCVHSVSLGVLLLPAGFVLFTLARLE